MFGVIKKMFIVLSTSIISKNAIITYVVIK